MRCDFRKTPVAQLGARLHPKGDRSAFEERWLCHRPAQAQDALRVEAAAMRSIDRLCRWAGVLHCEKSRTSKQRREQQMRAGGKESGKSLLAGMSSGVA